MRISIRSLSAITIYPNHSAGDRSGLHRCETSGCTSPAFGRPGSFQPATMPSADFCCVMVSPYGLISPKGQRSRSPGVNTYLSAHKRRVYAFGLRWIEDFALCCRLVPPKPPQLGSCTSPRAFAVPCRGRVASSPAPSLDIRLPYRYTLRLHQAGFGTCRAPQYEVSSTHP